MEKIVSTTTSVTASDAAARARELIPELRERAAQTALDRRLPLATIDALRKLGRAEDHSGATQRRVRARHPQPSRRHERARSGLRLDCVGCRAWCTPTRG